MTRRAWVWTRSDNDWLGPVTLVGLNDWGDGDGLTLEYRQPGVVGPRGIALNDIERIEFREE